MQIWHGVGLVFIEVYCGRHLIPKCRRYTLNRAMSIMLSGWLNTKAQHSSLERLGAARPLAGREARKLLQWI